jgi:hypothetical protein
LSALAQDLDSGLALLLGEMPTMQVERVDVGIHISIQDLDHLLGPHNAEVFADAYPVAAVEVLLLVIDHPVLHGLMNAASGDISLEGHVLLPYEGWVVLGVGMPLHCVVSFHTALDRAVEASLF